MYKITKSSDELYHYGVLGMRWGVRRYQNYDGTRIGTGGQPVVNRAKTAEGTVKKLSNNSFRNTIPGGQSGKAIGNAKFAASAGGSNDGSDNSSKKMSNGEKVFGPNIRKGKGKENSSVAVELSKSVKEGAESGRDIVKLAKQKDKKLQEQNAKQRQTQTQKAKKMSDQELRDSINRIKMEREYVSLTTKEVESGYDKADRILETIGKVAATGIAVGTFILTLYKIKKTLSLSDDSSDQLGALYSYGVENGIPEDVLEHAMELDLDYVLDYYDLTEEDIEHMLTDEDELYHHGILGQKWGVRRYQNYDGSRIGAGSGSGGGGGGSSTSKSFRGSVTTGQGGKAVGNARFAASSSIRPIPHKNPKNDKEKAENKAYLQQLSNRLESKKHRKDKTFGKEPEGYSFARQHEEDKLKQAVREARGLKDKSAAKQALRDHQAESRRKADEYIQWEHDVRKYTGNPKDYMPLVEGEKFTKEWINKHNGQIITNDEYWTAGDWDILPPHVKMRRFNAI